MQTIVAALLLLMAALWQSRATGLYQGFEGYALGALDANLTGGPNEGTNGGANPWFGSNPPNFRVVNAEFGVTPHSGTNMVRGCYNCIYDNDTDWFNLSYHCATGAVFSGDIALDWWFYDPLGAAGGGSYVDFVALGNYGFVPPDMDYQNDVFPPLINSQRLSLGANDPHSNVEIDTTLYQARIVDAVDAVNGQGWFNLTNSPRAGGWHHARIVIGPPNGADTQASFYIDDMLIPTLVHSTVNSDGFNILEINGDFGNTSGYFDDLSLADNVVPPSFITGPTNATVLVGGNASFSVSGASGSPAPSYSWKKNGSPVSNGGNISGATTATLTITGVLESQAGTYSCLVSNIAGVATSNAVLTVIVPPTIDSQNPSGSVSGGAGGNISFSVTAHATHTINYQWSKQGTGNLSNNGHFSGTTTSNLTISALVSGDAGTYSCHLSNADGSTDSAAVNLTVANGPTITTQPPNQSVAFGSNATFTVTAAGSGLVYRWSKGSPLSDGGRISGASSSALTISAVVDADAGSYSCLITNSGGSTNTSAAALIVVHAPTISSQPVSQVASNGDNVGFHVIATSSPAYQWRKNGTALSNGGDFSGVTTADLSVHVTTIADEGIYTVTVSNIAGSVTSSPASLRINQKGTTFFDNFESYSVAGPYNGGRVGTCLDYNFGNNTSNNCPWWGPSPPNFATYTNGQNGAPSYSGNRMMGGMYNSVTSGDNDEIFLNLSYRFNGGQLYYGNVMFDWHFYDPGTTDAGDQLSLANFGATRMPATSDSTGYQIPNGPIQHLFLGTWQNLDTTKYQAAVFGATDGTSGRFSKNITNNTKYFDTSVSRSLGWHHARIIVGPADPGTHVANARFFLDNMSSPCFTHDLPSANVGFNSIHGMACSVFSPATSETSGFFDDVTFQSVNDPYIFQQPASLTVNPGDNTNLAVVAVGSSYQWKKNGNAISAATTSTLTVNSAACSDQASYTVVVFGLNGSITSSAATLTVNGCPQRPTIIVSRVDDTVVLSWTGIYTLLSATNVTGPYNPIPGATSPYTNSPPLGSRKFFGLGL